MLLNKVVVGKGYKILHDNPTMTAPPAGYDSVSQVPSFLVHSKANRRMHRCLLKLEEVSITTN